MITREELERHGRVYGDLRLAIAFTNGITGEDAKKNDRAGVTAWKRARPLASADEGAALLAGRGLTHNPIVVLGASGLIGIDIDGADNDAQARARMHARDVSHRHLSDDLPATATVRSNGGVHLWYRAPEGCTPGFVKVQLTPERVTVSSDGYLVAPPARHPSGHAYAFLPGGAPWEIEIATLPLATVERLNRGARAAKSAMIVDTTSPISAGNRHEHLRRIAWVMRRYSGASLDAIEAALLAENTARCTPPKEERLVCALALYTYAHHAPKGG